MTDPTQQAIVLGILVFLIGAIGGTISQFIYFWLRTRLRRRELRALETFNRQASKAVHPASPIPHQTRRQPTPTQADRPLGPVVVPFQPRYPAPPAAAAGPLGRFDHPTDRRPLIPRFEDTVIDAEEVQPNYGRNHRVL